jgi:hypothetical protein
MRAGMRSLEAGACKDDRFGDALWRACVSAACWGFDVVGIREVMWCDGEDGMHGRVYAVVGSGDPSRGFVGLLRLLDVRYDVVLMWAAVLSNVQCCTVVRWCPPVSRFGRLLRPCILS